MDIKILKERVSTQEDHEYTPLEKLGKYNFNENRLQSLVNNFQTFTNEYDERTKIVTATWIVTRCYDEDVNYEETNHFLELVQLDSKIAQNIYSDYDNYHSIYDFEKEVMSTINAENKHSRDYYTYYKKIFGDQISFCQLSTSPEIQVKDDEHLIIEINDRVTKLVKLKHYKHKETKAMGEILLALAPIKVIEYSQSPPLFEWSFEDEMGTIIRTKPQTLKDTANDLKESGYVLQTKNLVGTLSSCLRALKHIGKPFYEKRRKLLPMGFHYENGEILMEGYDLDEYSDEDILEAIDVLEQYKLWFTLDEYTFLSTTFKWGLFAPFDYAYKTKQSTRFMKWLYLHGEGRVGKSNGYGKFVSHLWFDEPLPIFEKYYESFRTVPRFRNIISETTFPILMNETARALEESKDLKDMYKTCVEGTVITNTLGENAKTYHAYSAAICTSNGYISDESGAIEGRTLQMTFSHKMREEKHGKDLAFDKKWQVGSPTSPLNKLRAISHKFAQAILDNPEYITWEWQKATDHILSKIYQSVGKEVPSWLQEWVSNEESYNQQVEETKQTFYEAIQEIVNQKRNRDDTESNPVGYLLPILEQRKIVGLYAKNDGYVYITQSFLDNLYKRGYIELKQKLSQFAESYGWKYENKTINLGGKTRAKACKKPYDYFVNEVYDLDFDEQIDIG